MQKQGANGKPLVVYVLSSQRGKRVEKPVMLNAYKIKLTDKARGEEGYHVPDVFGSPLHAPRISRWHRAGLEMQMASLEERSKKRTGKGGWMNGTRLGRASR